MDYTFVLAVTIHDELKALESQTQQLEERLIEQLSHPTQPNHANVYRLLAYNQTIATLSDPQRLKALTPLLLRDDLVDGVHQIMGKHAHNITTDQLLKQLA